MGLDWDADTRMGGAEVSAEGGVELSPLVMSLGGGGWCWVWGWDPWRVEWETGFWLALGGEAWATWGLGGMAAGFADP